ncbi:MAG: antibiotic biosynthesis monooxygenase [Rhodospirillales bacterium]|nr:MAG: antibiotic biosynthesis monooxygenase [Rhodospirillales bacterium]
MAKLAIVATIKVVARKRDVYLRHLSAHAERCRATEPGTLRFDIMLPHNDADAVLLYEVYESPEAFTAHVNGASMRQIRADATGLQVSMAGTRCELVE